MEVPPEAAEQQDWSALPAGILQRILCLASTWQAPGSCLAAPVCRNWRSAAAGCRDICLLFHVGHSAADQSFAAWLGRNSQQLEALILTSSSKNIELILKALTEAAAAAQAAGRPLRLHTLRVLQGYVHVDIAGQLLACLPHLRCLQLGISGLGADAKAAPNTWAVANDMLLQHRATWESATQLEEAYLKMEHLPHHTMAGLLPLSLKRLSWGPNPIPGTEQYDLSHLTQLTFLQLCNRPWQGLTSSQLPPGLQQLGVWCDDQDTLELLEEQQQLVTAWNISDLRMEEEQQLLPRLPNLRAAGVDAGDLCDPAACAALQQLQHLLALVFDVRYCRREAPGLPEAVASAASIPGLRRLHLSYDLLPLPALDALTQLTQLRVSMRGSGGSEEQQQQQRAWAEVVGRMAGLQWLSVPDVLLTAGQAWLGGLQQLRVLVLSLAGTPEGCPPWLEGCSREGLPPRLQLLGVHGISAEQAADWQVRRRLQRLLGSSSGCEVVLGPVLDEVADPTQQLAGVPAALQQALV